MKRFAPLIKIGVGVGVGMLAMKANEKYGVVIDKDVLEAAIFAALASTNFKEDRKASKLKPQDAPKS